MADDDEANNCHFRWDIRNPFISERYLEATFYLGSPTITQWKLTLRPMDRGLQLWRYSVTLAFDETNDDRCEILTERIVLRIEQDRASASMQEVRNYRFCYGNQSKCYFDNIKLNYRGTELHSLVIRLDISLPRAARESEEECLATTDACLETLSRDLGRLLSDKERNMYPNLSLLSRNDPKPIQAHSYMLHARWNNFFSVHASQNTVQTNISKAVLSDILEYMYSGQFPIGWPVWRDPDYIPELFQVMNRYGLYHLHKVFVKSDLQQYRVTINPVVVESYLYPLNFVNGRRINDSIHTWEVENNPELTFRFIVRNDNRVGPWLSYSLQSRSSAEVRANVRLAVTKGQIEDQLEVIVPFHEKDYTMGPNTTVESTCVFFLGCPETFGYTVKSRVRYFIRCFLSVADGTFVDQIRNINNEKFLNKLARFGVLSDHMRQLQNEKFDADMPIRSCSGERDPHQDHIHKGIFVSRCLEWFDGLENAVRIDRLQNPVQIDLIPENWELPDNPICILSTDSLRFVLDYMYTGKVFSRISSFQTSDIYKFAFESQFHALADLMLNKSLTNLNIELDIYRAGSEPDYFEYRGQDGYRYVPGGYIADDGRLGAVARGAVVEEDFIGEAIRDLFS